MSTDIDVQVDLRSPTAPSTRARPQLRALVVRWGELYDTRNWLMMWVGLESASITLTRRKRHEAAATLEGFLHGHGVVWSATRDGRLCAHPPSTPGPRTVTTRPTALR